MTESRGKTEYNWNTFWEFHQTNGGVYEAFVRLAREAVGRGRTKIGIQMLFEVVRWEHFLRTEGDDFKLNNNWAAFYARLIMDQEEDLRDIFNLRRCKADDWQDEEDAA
jgi:hypothetical protein